MFRIKKYIQLTLLLLASILMIIGCSNDDEDNRQNDNKNKEETTQKDDEQPNKVDKGASDGDWGEDELDLSIGDTATLSTNFAMTEITLDSVEKVKSDDADDGEYTVLHMTVKNIGDEAAEFEDIFETTELSDDIADDGVEGGYIWEDETIDKSPGEVGVGEEVSGALIYDIEDVESYKLFINFGLSSTSNKVSYQFDKDEIE